MELHPLDPLGLMHRDPVDSGWVRAIHHGRMTVSQVLDRGRAQMEAEDEAERQAADPVGCVRASRARRTLFGRLLYGRPR